MSKWITNGLSKYDPTIRRRMVNIRNTNGEEHEKSHEKEKQTAKPPLPREKEKGDKMEQKPMTPPFPKR